MLNTAQTITFKEKKMQNKSNVNNMYLLVYSFTNEINSDSNHIFV